MKVEKVFCEQEILDIAEIKKAPFNKYGGPIWMDFQPGSYIKKDGTEIYSQNHVCQYVDKELIADLYNKWISSGDEKYKKAMEYFIFN